jgi:hypothetical protein
LIHHFKKREAGVNDDTFSQNESASQSEDRRAAKYGLLKAVGDELVFVQQEFAYLNSLDVAKESSVVEPGATVVTDQFTFFTGISGEQFEVEGGTIVRISTSAPIYTSIKGLQKGSSLNLMKRIMLLKKYTKS